MAKAPALVLDTLTAQPDVLQTEWLSELKKQGTGADHRISESELGQQSRELLQLLGAAVATGTDIQAEPWRAARDFLERLSRARAQQGFTSSETATFVFSLKRALFARIRAASKDATAVGDATWATTELIDALALHTVTTFQKSREDVIIRQQEDLLELSTPVVKLWDGVLALPMIGTLDSARTQVVMESLLQRIVETGAEMAIIDITGVPDRRHPGRAAPHQDGHRHPPDGRRLHHQRHPAADRADHRAPRRRSRGRDDEGDAGRRAGAGAEAQRPDGHPGQDGVAGAMDRIPILRMGEYLLVTIQVDMHDQLAMTLQDDLTTAVQRIGAKGVLIDISALEMVDSFIGRMIANLSRMTRILDARTVVVGMRPAVAITLVELGLSLAGVETALDVERGMRRLRAGVEESGAAIVHLEE